ncbi:hypothetical protein DYI24_00785 [Rhodopseudomonas sp. BR0C11]|uniref:hypothetical protein n=1 Tax=Rhodopseudomonas sp. BR0C11 TaxID=2269370 RepID=UPI0013E03FDD|nr:hypothetical protein [Rhodopseudomonas sp. BR0C11]NEV75613.1 hypothetical protein [Rhodopseudomonas sp. BR0C11]
MMVLVKHHVQPLVQIGSWSAKMPDQPSMTKSQNLEELPMPITFYPTIACFVLSALLWLYSSRIPVAAGASVAGTMMLLAVIAFGLIGVLLLGVTIGLVASG